MNIEQITLLLKAIVPLVSVILTAFVIPWIKSRVSAEKLNEIVKYTEIAVRCAEQIYSPDEWRDKKNYVMNYISSVACKLGINMDIEDIDNLIEGIVNEVKKG